MVVYLLPLGPERYELYCEPAPELPEVMVPGDTGVLGRLQRQFRSVVRAAEARHTAGANVPAPASGWIERLKAWSLAWVAERMAEQRLLWHLRSEHAVHLVHPNDITANQADTLVRRMLERDASRHLRWLVIDGVAFLVSGILAIVPGPNLIAYLFAFRVVGHWLSVRGARQGLRYVAWTGRPAADLVALRRLPALDRPDQFALVEDVARRLDLPSLPAFLTRVVRATR